MKLIAKIQRPLALAFSLALAACAGYDDHAVEAPANRVLPAAHATSRNLFAQALGKHRRRLASGYRGHRRRGAAQRLLAGLRRDLRAAAICEPPASDRGVCRLGADLGRRAGHRNPRRRGDALPTLCHGGDGRRGSVTWPGRSAGENIVPSSRSPRHALASYHLYRARMCRLVWRAGVAGAWIPARQAS